jgi:subtilase family serine protease
VRFIDCSVFSASHGVRRKRLSAAIVGLISTASLTFAVGCYAASAYAGETAVIAGNHCAEAASLASAGSIAAGRPLRMEITMALRNRPELDRLLRDLQDPSSPEYHRWLTPAEFQARFGPTPSDVAAVAKWLGQSGFQVDSTSAARRSIAFHGSADVAEKAFRVRIGVSADRKAFANLSDPSVPGDLAPLIASVHGLSNTIHAMPATQIQPDDLTPVPDVKIGNTKAFGPQDLYTFYDQSPLTQAGVDGSGTDCIAIIGDSNFHQASIDAFNSSFGLPPVNLSENDVDGPPGFNGDEIEALLDIQYAHAAAPGAPIRVYTGSPNGAGLFHAAQAAVTEDSCGSINISFSFCGLSLTDFTGTIEPLMMQAASHGQSITVSTGDWGAAALTLNNTGTACIVGKTRGVNEVAADPYATAVGGTQFNPKYNRSCDDIGHRREKVWKDTGKHAKNGGASGGGVSTIFSQPDYQQSVEPNQPMRTLPDISFGASPYHPGYFIGYRGAVECCIGGTSLGAPYWSGIAHLIAQSAGQARVGNLNPGLYMLGPSGSASGIRDARGGNNNFHGVKGFKAKRGYDLATGWGTPDLGVLVPALAALMSP